MATDLQNLQTLRSNLIQELTNESNFVLANGGIGKPTYSIDGESVSWSEWRTAMLEKIDKLTHMIQTEQTPFMGIMRMTG